MQRLTKETVDAATLRQAIEELGVGVPVRAWSVVRGRLVLVLATGRVARWPAPIQKKRKTDRGHPGRKRGAPDAGSANGSKEEGR